MATARASSTVSRSLLPISLLTRSPCVISKWPILEFTIAILNYFRAVAAGTTGRWASPMLVKVGLARPTRFERVTFAFGGQLPLYAASWNNSFNQSQVGTKNHAQSLPNFAQP
jgi:hypothetical protein